MLSTGMGVLGGEVKGAEGTLVNPGSLFMGYWLINPQKSEDHS